MKKPLHESREKLIVFLDFYFYPRIDIFQTFFQITIDKSDI